MQELKERILKEGKVLPGNIVKVDGFLNHRIDCKLMADIADEFAKLFDILFRRSDEHEKPPEKCSGHSQILSL